MKTILVPVPQNASIKKMKSSIGLICNKGEDKLHLLHVLTYPAATGLIDVVNANTDGIVEEMRAKDEDAFKKFAEDLVQEGYNVDISVPLGFFDLEFLDLVNKLNPSLILMFTSGSHSVIEDVFGTNTSHVFEKVTTPVLVINDEAELKSLKTAVVGLPLENEDQRAIAPLLSFAEGMGMTLGFVKIDNNFQLDIINDESVLASLQNLYPGKISHIIHRQSEDVSDGLQEFAKESGADLIVLFTTKRNFLEKLFHKSVTKDLVLHAKKPLLIYHY